MNARLNSTVLPLEHCRVLVAEDNPMNAMLIEAVLQHFGCHFEIVGAGDQAVALVQNGDIDVVLLDFHMPGLNGAQAATAIRDWEHQTRHRRVYVVGITASALPSEVAHCLDAGMDEVITKPFDIDKLRRVLLMACDIARAH